jgi:hypothetical protein
MWDSTACVGYEYLHVLPVLGKETLKDINSDQIDVLLKTKRGVLKPIA